MEFGDYLTADARLTMLKELAKQNDGRLAERLETQEKANDVQRQMLEAAARLPRDRNELAERLRDGEF
ncbi:hypothetical protein [Mesorhizobium xinjiangense]|uniref:hypothetical protein n=1 Tax=Mesorhizobium xinjiangense TaxID=2678685 RepID=UPI0012ED37A6|nr:hypothetical protein [Mesorhizobium xinjiangense]